MQVVTGKITRLMIFAPPQHGKSELVSVRLPVYWLGQYPDWPVILTSYAAALAENKSRQARNVIESWEYRNIFPGIVTDQNSRAVNAWSLAGHKGGLIAAGVGGPITGHGAMLGIIDDPVENWEQAQSKTYRDRAYDWYRTTFRTRLWEEGRIVLIMTRWHQDDLAGRLLRDQAERWTVLRLPALSEGMSDPLGRPEGEPLAPGRFSMAALADIKRDIGSMAWSAEYQGIPHPVEGALIDTGKLIFEERAPAGLRVARYWDLAAGVKMQNDYTVGAKVGVATDGHWWLLHIVRGRWAWPDARHKIAETARQDGTDCPQGIEDVAFQHAAYDDLVRMPELGGIRIQAIKPNGDKVARAGAWAGRVADSLFHVLRTEWTPAFVDEAASFPVGQHDDQIDGVSGAVQMLASAVRSEAPLPVVDSHTFYESATAEEPWAPVMVS